MQTHVRDRILQLTKADAVDSVELIQPLWNNYGTLARVLLRGGLYPSVIVKHIKIPEESQHPRGFTGSISRDRKVRSYQVETHWYQHQNKQVPSASPTPECLDAFAEGGELFLLLEDLANRGYVEPLYAASWAEITVVLRWLANFHARFLKDPAEGLWPCGTYWHLATRPEELAQIEGSRLHRFASLLDARLRCGGFPTLVHGDAKLANFLFTSDLTEVAGVDFQYVGRGCAMKDVAYFAGSCMSGLDCERREPELLAVYFSELCSCLPEEIDGAALEAEWRTLYPVAWADFQRFMTGWSPGHKKLTEYSDATTERAIEGITEDLMEAARTASLVAGRYIQAQRDRPLQVGSKGFESEAADVVTDIDLEAQALILDVLRPTIDRYDLGLLAEEGDEDGSRLLKHAFWTVDPLDGTQYYVEGLSGYATSIALVGQDGQPILGVVYDPVREDLYEVVRGRGVTVNGAPLGQITEGAGPTRWFADRSLRSHPDFERFQAEYEIQFIGGAVMNVLQLLTQPKSCYVKAPKKALGGCAIWDLAAVSLMLTERSGSACTYDGGALHLNRQESVFFNDVGLLFTSPDVRVEVLRERLRALPSANA